MDYNIRTRMFGKKEIVFNCDRCHDELIAPFEDAGLQQTCPKCGTPFITPGSDELNAEKQEHVRREAEARAREQQEMVAEKERREKMFLQSIQESKTKPSTPPPELVWYGAMSCSSCGYQWQARRQTPPARCPSCGKKSAEVVRVPKRTAGCLVLLIALIVPAAMAAAAYAMG